MKLTASTRSTRSNITDMIGIYRRAMRSESQLSCTLLETVSGYILRPSGSEVKGNDGASFSAHSAVGRCERNTGNKSDTRLSLRRRETGW